jgi:hypothetical protein
MYVFFKERWEASELVYKAIIDGEQIGISGLRQGLEAMK